MIYQIDITVSRGSNILKQTLIPAYQESECAFDVSFNNLKKTAVYVQAYLMPDIGHRRTLSGFQLKIVLSLNECLSPRQSQPYACKEIHGR